MSKNKGNEEGRQNNIFVKVDLDNKNGEDSEKEKSIMELRELFSYVGQQIQ